MLFLLVGIPFRSDNVLLIEWTGQHEEICSFDTYTSKLGGLCLAIGSA